MDYLDKAHHDQGGASSYCRQGISSECRLTALDEDARLAEEIALAELAALARELHVIEDQSERLSAMARAMGLARLREETRQRLALAVQMASD
jgi:hypothetical protein